jgi:hypothetical protein
MDTARDSAIRMALVLWQHNVNLNHSICHNLYVRNVDLMANRNG